MAVTPRQTAQVSWNNGASQPSLTFGSAILAGSFIVVVADGASAAPTGSTDTYTSAGDLLGDYYYVNHSVGGYSTISLGSGTNSGGAAFAYEFAISATLTPDLGPFHNGATSSSYSWTASNTTATSYTNSIEIGFIASPRASSGTPSVNSASTVSASSSTFTNLTAISNVTQEVIGFSPYKVAFQSGWRVATAIETPNYNGTGAVTGGSNLDYTAMLVTFGTNQSLVFGLTTAQTTIAAQNLTPSFAGGASLPTAQVTVQANAVSPQVVRNLVASITANGASDNFTNTAPAGIAAVAASGATYIRLVNLSGVPQLNASAGSPPVSTGGGTLGSVPVAQSDHTVFTVTAAAQTQLAKNWAVPLADLSAGAAWRLTAFGAGTEAATTSRTLTFFASMFGNAAVTLTAYATTVVPASGAFTWNALLNIVCTAVSGTSFTFKYGGTVTVTESVTAVDTTSVAASVAGSITSTITSATNCELGAGWSSATGTPTISSAASVFEKVV